ncbi:MAG: hypothetical protein JWM27_1002 [Gemmatimonadetes bacterium]|nr:hypothetical protein [Gemmatimonadota bacterium]
MPQIIGHVLNDERHPVPNARVSLKGRQVAETGADGFFAVKVAKPESRIALTFAAEGYVPNTKVFDSAATGTNAVALWPVAYRVTFDPSRDLDVGLGSSRIRVPARALAGAGMERPGSAATLRFTLFDVTSRQQRAAAPGDFSGRLLDRGIRRLSSYGIFDLGISDSAGRPLGLRPDARIDLSISVPRRLADSAPQRVGFFDFDTGAGLWNQVGTFELARTTLTYNGTVTSFGGAHNLDDPQDTVCVTLKVQSIWGYAIPFASVTAHGLQYDSSGTTDANGLVCLLVQRNASFSAGAFATVGTSHYTSAPLAQQSFTSPDFSSGAGSCGDPALCPLVGTLLVDLIVGL